MLPHRRADKGPRPARGTAPAAAPTPQRGAEEAAAAAALTGAPLGKGTVRSGPQRCDHGGGTRRAGDGDVKRHRAERAPSRAGGPHTAPTAPRTGRAPYEPPRRRACATILPAPPPWPEGRAHLWSRPAWGGACALSPGGWAGGRAVRRVRVVLWGGARAGGAAMWGGGMLAVSWLYPSPW